MHAQIYSLLMLSIEYINFKTILNLTDTLILLHIFTQQWITNNIKLNVN